jgi:hypothetical protein
MRDEAKSEVKQNSPISAFHNLERLGGEMAHGVYPKIVLSGYVNFVLVETKRTN